ncbi:hypothetical protein B4N84_23180 [Flavobacterium sp. IR1]|nr:hypothetical protein B4N84_23180 [Flavobacterium sp. IR1]
MNLLPFFTKELVCYRDSDEIKRAVSFVMLILFSGSFGSQYDLIICRNVMIYSSEDARHKLYQIFSKVLRPGGVLFVGSTEQIFHADQYHFETEDTFFYKKKR